MRQRVEGHGLVLDLLDRMPGPHALVFGVGAVQQFGMFQGGMGEDRREVFQRHRHRQLGDRMLPARFGQPRLDALHLLGNVIAGGLDTPVERVVLARVEGFLFCEIPDLCGQRGRHILLEAAHAFDEEGLAGREGDRQRIVPGRGHRIAAEPPAPRRVLGRKTQVARLDGQIGRCARNRHGRGSPCVTIASERRSLSAARAELSTGRLEMPL